MNKGLQNPIMYMMVDLYFSCAALVKLVSGVIINIGSRITVVKISFNAYNYKHMKSSFPKRDKRHPPECRMAIPSS